MSHLEAGLLHALLDGEIPSDQLPPIQAHLAGCAECRERLEQERQLLAEAEGLVEVLQVPAEDSARPAVFQPSGHPHWGRRLAWAASVLAAVGLGYAARGSRPPAASRELAVAPAAPPVDSASVIASAQSTSTEPRPTPAEPASVSVRPSPNPPAAKPSRGNAGTGFRKLEVKAPTERLDETVASGNVRPDSSVAAREGLVAAPPVAADRSTGVSLARLRDEPRAFGQLKATTQPLLAPPEPVSLTDAVRRLGGSLRLVEGLVPLRLEAQGPTVRVVYSVAQGELVLSQQLIDGRVSFQLIAPPGFPTDSLGKLRARVRE